MLFTNVNWGQAVAVDFLSFFYLLSEPKGASEHRTYINHTDSYCAQNHPVMMYLLLRFVIIILYGSFFSRVSSKAPNNNG